MSPVMRLSRKRLMTGIRILDVWFSLLPLAVVIVVATRSSPIVDLGSAQQAIRGAVGTMNLLRIGALHAFAATVIGCLYGISRSINGATRRRLS